MKEITLEDLKTEINNNLWRVTKFDNFRLECDCNCYIRFTGIDVSLIVVIENKCTIIMSLHSTHLLNCVDLKYFDGSLQVILLNDVLVLSKQEFNEEVHNLLITQDIPF